MSLICRTTIDGALGTLEAAGIVEAVKEDPVLSAANVIATMDTHFETICRPRGKISPRSHCIREQRAGRSARRLRLLKGARFMKPTFGSMKLAADLKAAADKEEIELELIGLCQISVWSPMLCS